MESLLHWGMGVILTVQKIHGPELDVFFRALTSVGTGRFYALILLPFLLWCVDFRVGARLSIFFLLSIYLNSDLKDLFHQPRPFHLNPEVQLFPATGYGLPSGHAQSAVVVWSSIAVWVRKPWLWVLAILLILLIGFSRIYLGAHFPTDVFAGWVIGAALVGLYLATQSRIAGWLIPLNQPWQVLLALVVPLALLQIHPTAFTMVAMGALAGAGIGLSLTHRYLPFNAHGPWQQRLCRFLVGGAVVFSLYFGLKKVFPGQESTLYSVFRLARYFLIGLWITMGAPWLFWLLHLAEVGKRREQRLI